MKKLKMSNGIEIPQVGFGTFKIPNEDAAKAVQEALEVGYRHIDTAAIYKNEEGVGQGIKNSGLTREDIFLVSKVWNTEQSYDNTLRAYDDSLKRLGVDYLDLYLIHWAKPLSGESWKALEKLYKEKRVRSIGVSNFTPKYFDLLLKDRTIEPMVNQIELHPHYIRVEERDYCKEREILVESWSTLKRGEMLEIDLIKELAEKYGKATSQIVLRWAVELGYIIIPKSTHKDRMKENIDIFNFELSNEDRDSISALNKDESMGSTSDIIYNKAE